MGRYAKVSVIFLFLASCHIPFTSWGYSCLRRHLPIYIYFDKSADQYRMPTMKAASEWSRVMGQEVFIETDSKDVGDITVSVGPVPVDVKADWIASTKGSCQDDRLKYSIVFHKSIRTLDAFLTAEHELGHALGLAHSNDITSVMFPSMELGDNYCDMFPVITKEDREHVTAIYK